MDPLVGVALVATAAALGLAAGVAAGRRQRPGGEAGVDRLTAVVTQSSGPVGDEPPAAAATERATTPTERQDLIELTELAGVGIVHLDLSLRVDLANRAAHAFLDRPAGGLAGLTAIEAFVDERVERLAATALDRGRANAEIDLRGREGLILAIRARRSPLGGVWVVLEDLSELRRLQQIRAEFIDNLSHEIRTPLTNLSLLAETLSREADGLSEPLPVRMRERIAKIEVETGHLIQMINELLDLTRIEAGGAFVAVDEVDLGSVAAATVERLRLFAERQGVDLRLELPETPPPPVRGDEERLGQVLVNLLHNAVKFSPDGGTVTVRVRATDEAVVTSVEDQGIGIRRADQARIFERFFKADRARVRGGGTGLGLAIARHVVEQHGGTIGVESTPGRGSTFTFEIPIAAGPITIGEVSTTARP